MKWLLSVFLFFFIYCHESTKTSKQPGTIAALNIPSDSSSIFAHSAGVSTELKTAEGLLLASKSKCILKTCNRKAAYILVDENHVLFNLYLKTIGNLSYENESIYARIKGSLKNEDTLVVTRIEEVKPKSFLTPCFNYAFILLGTEPFWSVEILPEENIITLKDVSMDKSYILPYHPPSIKENEYTYVSRNEKGDTLEIHIHKENCNDGMSDSSYSHSAEITINGRAMTGCAIKRGDKL